MNGYVVVGQRRGGRPGRSTLEEDVTVGSDCWIRPNVTIKRSILLPGSSVGEGAYLEDCIVGHGYDVRRRGDHPRGSPDPAHVESYILALTGSFPFLARSFLSYV